MNTVKDQNENNNEKIIYYLNPVPSDINSLYITSRIKNPAVERGHLQYKIIPELLKNVNIKDKEYGEEYDDCVVGENTEENLKRLLPLTKTAGDIKNYKLLLVIIAKKENNIIWLKGALLNIKINKIALMTSKNNKDNSYRFINSHDPEYFIGHYRLSAPPKFWIDLIKIVSQMILKIEEEEKKILLPIKEDKLEEIINPIVHYIYLIHIREWYTRNKNIYKFGRTSQPANNRINRLESYPKNSKIILLIECNDSLLIENIIKTELKKNKEKFKFHNDGYEHIVGDKYDIVDLIMRIVRDNK